MGWANFFVLVLGLCAAEDFEGSVLLEPEDAINREALFKSTIGSWIQNRSVKIKVGILNVEGRDSTSEFWVEFDPVAPSHVSRERIILPYIVNVDEEVKTISFHKHKHAGCSSILKPSGSYSQVNQSQYVENGIQLCERFVSHYSSINDTEDNSTSESLFYSQWKLWHQPYVMLDAFKTTFSMSSSMCYHCQAEENIEEEMEFNAISLGKVINWFEKIDFIDIDAQGLDVSLILSLSEAQVSRVGEFKIECQGSVDYETGAFAYLYYYGNSSYTFNSCKLAQERLQGQGFECKYEVNNCGCAEFNLFCKQVPF